MNNLGGIWEIPPMGAEAKISALGGTQKAPTRASASNLSLKKVLAVT